MTGVNEYRDGKGISIMFISELTISYNIRDKYVSSFYSGAL